MYRNDNISESISKEAYKYYLLLGPVNPIFKSFFHSLKISSIDDEDLKYIVMKNDLEFLRLVLSPDIVSGKQSYLFDYESDDFYGDNYITDMYDYKPIWKKVSSSIAHCVKEQNMETHFFDINVAIDYIIEKMNNIIVINVELENLTSMRNIMFTNINAAIYFLSNFSYNVKMIYVHTTTLDITKL